MRACLLFLSLALVPQLFAGEVWVFLNDGTVCWGDPASSPLQLKGFGGKTIPAKAEDIRYQRTREEVDLAVTQMVAEIIKGKNLEQHAKRFMVLNWAVTPKLLECLKKPDPQQRLTALFALQYGWSPPALEPVLAALKDADKDIQKAAWQVLIKNVPAVELSKLVRPLADDEDLDHATIAFEIVDQYFPDESLKRVQRMLRAPGSRSVAITRLSHYRSPKLTDDTLALLSEKEVSMRRGAVVGLISQLADGDAARAKVKALLADPNSELREIAGEYFTWLGKREDIAALRNALESERDAYARAALEAAVKTIETRSAAWEKSPALATEFKQIRETDALEPTFIYNVHEHTGKSLWRDKACRIGEVLAAPAGAVRSNDDFVAFVKVPRSGAWMPPLRDYYEPARKSFGFCVTKDFTSFVGSVHIGDDVGWNKELRTVVAPAPGIVRRVDHVFSWGFIVVIEHEIVESERVCTLYAHLSPMLHVKPGDVVKAGQKIGSTGRALSVENGGYGSHLHFGLHNETFGIGSWVCGYIGQQDWASGAGGWLDPQAFLKTHADPK